MTAHFPSQRWLFWINIFIVYFVSVLRTNAHPHIYVLSFLHCVENILFELTGMISGNKSWNTFDMSLLSVSHGGKAEKKSLMHVLGTFCSCFSLSHFSWLQSETRQMRTDLFSTLQMCWNEFSHSPHRMLFLFAEVQICSTTEDRGSRISQQATDIPFPNLACRRRQKINRHLPGFPLNWYKHHEGGFYKKYI